MVTTVYGACFYVAEVLNEYASIDLILVLWYYNFMNEFNDDFGPKPEFPARMRMFNEVAKLQGSYVERLKAQLARQNLRLTYESVVHFKRSKKELELPRLGVNEGEFGMIAAASSDEYGLIKVLVQLYEDGSPRILDGDDIDGDSHYSIFLAQEMPPTMIQEDIYEKKIRELASEGQAEDYSLTLSTIKEKHLLTDEECEKILELLSGQTLDEVLADYEDVYIPPKNLTN